MRTVIITFTHEGMKVAKKASTVTDGEVTIYCHKRCADDYREDAVSFATVGSVIKNEFAMCDRILFVCAAEIAVRTIAPYLKSKVTDPAVLVADESGKFLISLLSGHIGGANEWCKELADSIGAIPVITTSTDTRGMFAVDLFAAEHNMKIVNPVMIQDILEIKNVIALKKLLLIFYIPSPILKIFWKLKILIIIHLSIIMMFCP